MTTWHANIPVPDMDDGYDILDATGMLVAVAYTKANGRAIAALPSLVRELESLLAWDADAVEADPQGYEVDQANAVAALKAAGLR